MVASRPIRLVTLKRVSTRGGALPAPLPYRQQELDDAEEHRDAAEEEDGCTGHVLVLSDDLSSPSDDEKDRDDPDDHESHDPPDVPPT
jgi:hypothetical protein